MAPRNCHLEPTWLQEPILIDFTSKVLGGVANTLQGKETFNKTPKHIQNTVSLCPMRYAPKFLARRSGRSAPGLIPSTALGPNWPYVDQKQRNIPHRSMLCAPRTLINGAQRHRTRLTRTATHRWNYKGPPQRLNW